MSDLTSGRSASDPSGIKVLKAYYLDFDDPETFDGFLEIFPLIPFLRELYVNFCNLSDDKGPRLCRTLNDFNLHLSVLDLKRCQLRRNISDKLAVPSLIKLSNLLHHRLSILDISGNSLLFDNVILGESFLSQEFSQFEEIDLGIQADGLIPAFSRSGTHSFELFI